MLIKTTEIPQQKYEPSDLTKMPLKDIKRRYELGMVFTAMLSQESDERAPKASVILAIQMRNLWNEWHTRMADRELRGLPTFEIWQRVSKDELIKVANREPKAVKRHVRNGKPIQSDQIVVLNTLDLRSKRN